MTAKYITLELSDEEYRKITSGFCVVKMSHEEYHTEFTIETNDEGYFIETTLKSSTQGQNEICGDIDTMERNEAMNRVPRDKFGKFVELAIDETAYYECPTCFRQHTNPLYEYCPWCGQALEKMVVNVSTDAFHAWNGRKETAGSRQINKRSCLYCKYWTGRDAERYEWDDTALKIKVNTPRCKVTQGERAPTQWCGQFQKDTRPDGLTPVCTCQDCKWWIGGGVTDGDDFIPPKCELSDSPTAAMKEICNFFQRKTPGKENDVKGGTGE